MAHNTRPLKRAQDGVAPQYYNPTTDEYEVLLGQDGAARAILYGPNGQPIGTAGNPLQVKAHDTDTVLGQIKDALGPLATETKLEAVRALLAALNGKDFATQTTLAQVKQVLDALSGAVSTSAGQADIQQAIAALAGIVAKESTLGQAKGVLDAISSGVASRGSEQTLAQVKGELELVKAELQAMKANQLSGDAKVQLSGNIMEYYGATVEQRPEATEVPVGAAYMAVNTGDVWQSNGFEWVVL